MFVRIIDDNGNFVTDDFVDEIPLATETVIVDGEEIMQPLLDEFGNTYLDKHYIETPCPEGFILPKWNGTEWVEGGEILPLTDEQKEQMYKDLVVSYIREQYSADDEQAILRKKIAGIDEGEFDIFNTFVEECKVKAKTQVFADWEDDIPVIEGA